LDRISRNETGDPGSKRDGIREWGKSDVKEIKVYVPIKYPCAPCNSTPEKPASAINLAVSTKALIAPSISSVVISLG
jgi:hypothetical protein